jgi:TonB-linked SusC/RagA family outer membrane protein
MKLLLIMRITTFFLLAVNLHVAATGLSQQISLKEKDASLRKVFTDIRRSSGLAIIFDNNILKKMGPVSIDVKEMPVEDVLGKVLSGLPLTWLIEDKIIFISARKQGTDPGLSATAPPPPAIRDLHGIIKDPAGHPLAGATVSLKASPFHKGVATDAGGRFDLTGIPDGEYTFEVSMVGYKKWIQTITIGKTTPTLSILLKEEASNLDETVIIGYGTTTKKDLTGSVSTIDAARDFKDVPIPRIDQMLQGRAAGVDVKSVDGAPGSGTTIRIRGSRSISATNEPLYVVDGVVGIADLNSFSPDDIESISILKDASAAAIYGSRGSNGVVIITTKRGKPGADRINFSAASGTQQLPRTLDLMNAPDFAKFENDARVDAGLAPLYDNIDSLIKVIGNGTNWTKATTRTATYSNYNLSLSGGTGGPKGMTYYISGNIMKQQGIILGTDYDRYQMHLNLDKQISSKIKWGSGINITRYREDLSNVDFGSNLGWEESMETLPPTMPVYNANGTLNAFNPIYYAGGGNINSPVAKSTLQTNTNTVTNLLGNLYAEYEIIKGLKWRSTLGTNLSYGRVNTYLPSYMPVNVTPGTQTGTATSTVTSGNYLLNENTLTYDHSIGKHHLNATGGLSEQQTESDGLGASGSGLTDDIMQYNNLGVTNQANRGISSSYTNTTLISYFGRVNYDYASKYYLTFTSRYDGASNFALNKKWGYFPSGAVKWNVSKEDFFRHINTHVLNNLAFRASYGSSGNQGIAAYSSLASLNATGAGYLFGGEPSVAFTQGNLANNDLSWETTNELDLGTDFQLFSGRISVTADYYKMHTHNLLLSVQIPYQTGYSTRLENVGETMSEGLELGVTADIIQTKNFSWSLDLTSSTNKQEVLNLGPLVSVALDNNNYGANTNYLEVGVPLGANFGLNYAGTWKSQAEINTELAKPAGKREYVSTTSFYAPGKPKYYDYNHDGLLTQADYHYLGTPNPKLFGGIGNTFRYKHLTLDFFLEYDQGNTMFNDIEFFMGTGTYLTNQFKYMDNRWSAANPTSNVPAVNSRDNIPSTWELHDASFIRLKSSRLTYNITNKAINKAFRSMNIFLAGSNLFLLTKYNGFDPEVNSGGASSTIRAKDNGTYPNSRTVSAGINLGL